MGKLVLTKSTTQVHIADVVLVAMRMFLLTSNVLVVEKVAEKVWNATTYHLRLLFPLTSVATIPFPDIWKVLDVFTESTESV